MHNMKRARLEDAIGCLPADKWGLNFQTCNTQLPNDTCSYYKAYYYSGAMHTCKHVEPTNKYSNTKD